VVEPQTLLEISLSVHVDAIAGSHAGSRGWAVFLNARYLDPSGESVWVALEAGGAAPMG